MTFVGAVLATLLIPFFVGYPVACALRMATGPRRLAWGGIVGLAVVILALRTTQYIVPLGAASWWLSGLFLLAMILGWRRTATRTALRRDGISLTPVGMTVLGLFIVALIVALNLPILLHHLVAFDGTPNRDSILYVNNARWMLDNRFFDKPSFSPGHPLQSFEQYFFGWGAIYGRVGAGGLMAYISTLVHRDPVYAYNGVLTAGAVWGAMTSTVVMERNLFSTLRKSPYRYLYLLAFFCTPALLLEAFNSNFASVFGIIFFTAYAVVSMMAGSRRKLLAGVLLLGALAATYSELIIFAWLIIGLGLTASLCLNPSRARLRQTMAVGIRIAGVAVVTSVVFFWLTLSSYFVIHNAFFMAAEHPQMAPDVYAGLSPARYAIAFLTTSRSYAAWLPISLCVLGLAALTWLAIRVASARQTRTSLLWGAGLAFVLIAAYMFLKPFHYGKLKVVEYFALYMAPVAVLGSDGLRRIRRRSLLGAIDKSAFVISVVLALGACTFLVRESLFWGAREHISKGMMKLSRAVSKLPANATVAIGATSGPYYYPMWFPYLMPQTPMLFNTENGAGYLHAYIDAHPYAPYDAADYMIVGADEYKPGGPLSGRILGLYGDFYLIKTDPLTAVNGVYGSEGAYRWLGQTATFKVGANQNGFFNISLGKRYKASSPMDRMTVVQDGKSCVLQIDTRGSDLSIPFQLSKGSDLTLQFALPALSPAQFGAKDARTLTYKLMAASASAEPLYKIASCEHSTPE